MKNHRILIISSILLSYLFMVSACNAGSSSQNSNRRAERKAQTITLIFDKHLPATDTFFIDEGWFRLTTIPEVTYYDDFHFKDLTLKKDAKDTLTINPSSENVIVRHRLDGINYYEFLFAKGDTVLFKYENGKPLATIINRELLPFDNKYDQIATSRFYPDFTERGFKYFNPALFINRKERLKPGANIKQQETNIRQNEYATIVSKFNEENKFLDSLKNNNILSNIHYDFYKNRIKSLSLLIDIKENKLSIAESSEVMKGEETASKTFPNLYYNRLLEMVSDHFFAPNAKAMDLKDGFNRDHREIFDAIMQSDIFKPNAKNYLLTRQMSLIAKSFSKKDFQKYFGVYKANVQDTSMVHFIEQENILALDVTEPNKEKLSLINANKVKLTFDDIKAKYKGKIIYVDFWASWCVPCRVAMPSSLKLKEQMKDVVFVYLSIDKGFEDWKKASLAEDINDYVESYLITNPEVSDFMRKYKIATIPRYMIFDKQGNMLYENAMSPESKQIIELLNKLANGS